MAGQISLGGASSQAASPPTDIPGVPHYFGPWPNWANSPFTLPKATVEIAPPGQGATFIVTVAATGEIANARVTNGGSGYNPGTQILFSGPSGSGAYGVPRQLEDGGRINGVRLVSRGSGYTPGQTTATAVGSGSGATAVATVDPVAGGIRDIQVTNPGSGYFSPPGDTVLTSANVIITDSRGDGFGAGATASATSTNSGAVVAFDGIQAGAGYSEFVVTLTGGGGSGATAIGTGGVDAVTLSDPGLGYTMPTVDFDWPDSPDGEQAVGHAKLNADGSIDAVIVDDPGSGYITAPGVVIRNGTANDPILLDQDGNPWTTPATATATLKLSAVYTDAPGSGYTSAPTVTISDPDGGGVDAAATAIVEAGAITGIQVINHGAGYLQEGMKKFIDQLPMLCDPSSAAGCDPSKKTLPLAVPVVGKDVVLSGKTAKTDQYEIGLVQYRTSFSSDLPQTMVRGYVQIETPEFVAAFPGKSQHFALYNEMLDGSRVAVTINGQQAYGVTSPQWLGPVIAAEKDKPVRIVFRNLLPTGVAGDLFMPVDTTFMGAGDGPTGMPLPADEGTVYDDIRNPACEVANRDGLPTPKECFTDNRATLHLHGGISPWISDGTPHQWITPANEATDWPEGVSVGAVPDMADENCDDPTYTDPAVKRDGCSTFFYTNQQSARLMFYHDHAWGITRLNVYAGEAAGYIIGDKTEKKLVGNGTLPGDEIPLVVQDRTFVPDDDQMFNGYYDPTGQFNYGQDPTWDTSRWGTKGQFWYQHVYMPAQNPGDPSGMSAFGRWMYGPWFWPPAANTVYGPIDNPYFDPNCRLDDPSTWQYDTDPFCEPALIPGTPNNSAGMEQFNDTPTVNGVAYPTVTLEPKSYRFRILNAANDRFFNLQWYKADPNQLGPNGNPTEVRLNPAEVAAAQTDPNIFPTPAKTFADGVTSTDGPDWVQYANEGGWLPSPAVIDGQQPTTWIIDPTRFDVGNVDLHSLLVAPAERADVVVDFSKFAGQTLILYNDAPAAFPARVASYDYYTGAPDMRPVGAPPILPGYGPNTRTVMQVKIAGTPAAPFSITKLRNAFKHHADGSGVFESAQNPEIVGQAEYNSAYGTRFPAASDCNVSAGDAAGNQVITSTSHNCDGKVRVNDNQYFKFDGLSTKYTVDPANPKKVDFTSNFQLDVQPKAIHDEMNATTFDVFGRMQANLGIEAQPPTPGLQNVTLYPYVNPPTEVINAQKLPTAPVAYDANGQPDTSVEVKPMTNDADGTQLWRITHNGVDTHPIHFHLYDVQVINRVTWDNIIIPNDPNENGWKDTVRMSPLEDTIVALRPVKPDLPWEVPNSIRPLSPMMPVGASGAGAGFNNVLPDGQPMTNGIANDLVNFGWEYVWHCHILSHEEMDMMRPQAVAVPPNNPSDPTIDATPMGRNNVRYTITSTDNSIAETQYVLQRTSNGTDWVNVGAPKVSPLVKNNGSGGPLVWTTTGSAGVPFGFRVVGQNTVGYDAAFGQTTASSYSAMVLTPGAAEPSAPSRVTAARTGSRIRVSWGTTAGAAGYVIQRSVTPSGGTPGAWVQVASVGANSSSWLDANAPTGASYQYKVSAYNVVGASNFTSSNTV
ncbi:MAG: multicopper oxidase domain-containing protein [Candidatus Nanopelagicales bacterium]